MATNLPPKSDEPRKLDFPAMEGSRQDLVAAYAAMVKKMIAALARALDALADDS